MYDETTTFTGLDLFDIWKDKKKVVLTWMTGVDDDYMFKGEAYLTNYEQSAGTNEAASYSCTFEGTGSISKTQINTASDTIQHV